MLDGQLTSPTFGNPRVDDDSGMEATTSNAAALSESEQEYELELSTRGGIEDPPEYVGNAVPTGRRRRAEPGPGCRTQRPRGARQNIAQPSPSDRAITSRCTSLVPSPISRIFASR